MENYKEEIAKLQTQLDELKSKIEKPKYKVGKWYKALSNKALYYIVEFNGINKDGKNYGFDYNGNWMELNDRCFSEVGDIEATRKEVEDALIKEAVKRYGNGYFDGIDRGGKQKFDTLDFDHFKTHGVIYNSAGEILYKKGTWATPIKSKTIREIFETSTIDFYKSAEQYSLYDDLINYLTENKQEIIETLNNL